VCLILIAWRATPTTRWSLPPTATSSSAPDGGRRFLARGTAGAGRARSRSRRHAGWGSAANSVLPPSPTIAREENRLPGPVRAAPWWPTSSPAAVAPGLTWQRSPGERRDYNGFNLFVADGDHLGLLCQPGRASAALPERWHLRPLQPPARHPLAQAGERPGGFCRGLVNPAVNRRIPRTARRPGDRCRCTPAGNRHVARLGAPPLGRLRPLRKLWHPRVDLAHLAAGRPDDLVRTQLRRWRAA
jgi:hypothetical protein